MAPVFKINALRMLMTGKAKEHFDLWEGDRYTTDALKSHEELLNKVKDYARRRKLDTTAQNNTQDGGDPMDVGAVRENWDCNWDEEEIDAVGYYGYRRKGKSKGKGKGGALGGSQCVTCGSASHFAKDCPYKGKGEGEKGIGKEEFQGVCYNYG